MRVTSKSYVYALADPVSGVVRYVGQSVNPWKRYRQHLSRTRGKVGEWIKFISATGSHPALVVLGKFDENKIHIHEQKFIFKYENLLNTRAASVAGSKNNSGYVVECIDTGEIFKSCAHAARHYRCSPSTIVNRCNDGGETYPSNMKFRKVYW